MLSCRLPTCSLLVLAALLAAGSGCSINKGRLATEQLVVSDAVDAAVAQVDFSPLTGQTVYFDSKYLNNARLPGNSNVEYVISALRQQMLAYDLRLAEKPEEADLILEARVGTLGNDNNEVTYGIPGSAALTTASWFMSAPMAAPTMPELSIGRRNHHLGAAKIGIFAYDRVSHERIWQAGVTTGTSHSRDLWVMGFGPFQRGAMYKRLRREDHMRDTILAEDASLAALNPRDAYASQIDFRSHEQRQARRNDPPTPIAPASGPQR